MCKAIKRSGVPREDLFITTKLWIQDAGYDLTKRAFEKSLAKLQLEMYTALGAQWKSYTVMGRSTRNT